MKIKTIDVNAKEWFDVVNGNSYFSGDITLNYGTKTQKELAMPFQYGYGNHYLDIACDMLDKAGYINNKSYTGLPRYCRENNIILRYQKQENCKKRDL